MEDSVLKSNPIAVSNVVFAMKKVSENNSDMMFSMSDPLGFLSIQAYTYAAFNLPMSCCFFNC